MIYLLIAALLTALAAVLLLNGRASTGQRSSGASASMTIADPFVELAINEEAETITVRAISALHLPPQLPPERARLGPVDLTFTAAGFSVEVRNEPQAASDRRRAARGPDVYTRDLLQGRVPPERPGMPPSEHCTLVLRSRRHPLATLDSEAAVEVDEVRIGHLAQADLRRWQPQLQQLTQWVTAMEAALRERVASHARERYLARARADQQLAALTRDRGFEPSHSALDFDPDGQLLWAIQVNDGGQVWLLAEGQIFAGSLGGATVTRQGDGLVLTLRDAAWERAHFSRRRMRLLTGLDQASLAEWERRLQSLAAAARPGF